jgi:hypothetical protein
MIDTENIVLKRQVKEEALYAATQYFISRCPDNFTAEQIIEAIEQGDESVTLWLPLENLDRSEVVWAIKDMANTMFNFAVKYTGSQIKTYKFFSED